MTEDPKDSDWGNVRFRPRSWFSSRDRGDDADTRFVTGLVVFLLVALAYPWYSYWVQTRLAARDMAQVAEEMGRQLRAETERSQQQQQVAAQRRRVDSQRQRVNRVRVVGATAGGGSPLVIVDLGEAELAEAASTICQQAEGWLHRPLDGVTLRVQLGQAGKGAIRMGTLRC